MNTIKRTVLVPVSGILSIYPQKKNPGRRWYVDVFKEGRFIAPDMKNALYALDQAVRDEGGDFYIIDLFRSYETQLQGRLDYESGKKSAYVARPGSSFHNAGRSIDVSVQELNFVGITKRDWLSKLWNIAIPLGFSPIIAKPDINVSEAWHFDFLSEWQKVKDDVGYSESAKCACIDSGNWNIFEGEAKRQVLSLQAQLIRLGFYSIGSLDGIMGDKTKNVLKYLQLPENDIDEATKILMRR